MIEQAKKASDRIADSERMRTSAAQEAAYYRAKLAALENGNEGEVTKLERERVTDLERHMSTLMTERWSQDRKIQELNDSLALQVTLYEQAEARATEASQRLSDEEEHHESTAQRLTDVQQRLMQTTNNCRNHTEQLLTQTSALEQRSAEDLGVRSQIEELTQSREHHIRALDQVRTALRAASSRAEEVDRQYQRAREHITTLQSDMSELRGELEARTSEAEGLRTQLTDVENSFSKSREEADALRALTTGSLGELLDSHRDLKTDEDRYTRGHDEKILALEAEVASLRDLLQETSRGMQESSKSLEQERRRYKESSSDQASLRAQVHTFRSQLSAAQAETARLQKQIVERETEIRSKVREASEQNTRMATLRTYLAENGVAVDDDDLRPGSRAGSRANGATSPFATSDLENKLAERGRLHDLAERELAQANRKLRDAETHANQLSTQLDRLRSTQSPRGGDVDERIAEAERKQEETERGYRTRMQQMEEDYQLAVHYVK